MIKRFKQLIIITVMFVLAMPTVILAEFPPMPPILISGTVTINGNIASSGTVSVAGVNASVGSDGKYSILLPSENNGKLLTFKVNDKIATSQTVTSPTQEVNLLITATSSSNNNSGGTFTGIAPASTASTSEETPKIPSKIPVVKGAITTEIIDGDIIQCQSSDNPFAVYIVKIVGDTKYIRHIVSLEIFNYYGHLKWENLKQVDSLSDYSLSGWARHNTGPNGTPGPTDKVYEINGDQTKHWINMTAEDFLSHGGSELAIYSVNQGELDLYATGADVMSL